MAIPKTKTTRASTSRSITTPSTQPAQSPSNSTVPTAPTTPTPTPTKHMDADWSEARKQAWKLQDSNENAYYFRFNAPGEMARTGPWTEQEREVFFQVWRDYCGVDLDLNNEFSQAACRVQWGLFSKLMPGRVGYQCSYFYHSLFSRGRGAVSATTTASTSTDGTRKNGRRKRKRNGVASGDKKTPPKKRPRRETKRDSETKKEEDEAEEENDEDNDMAQTRYTVPRVRKEKQRQSSDLSDLENEDSHLLYFDKTDLLLKSCWVRPKNYEVPIISTKGLRCLATTGGTRPLESFLGNGRRFGLRRPVKLPTSRAHRKLESLRFNGTLARSEKTDPILTPVKIEKPLEDDVLSHVDDDDLEGEEEENENHTSDDENSAEKPIRYMLPQKAPRSSQPSSSVPAALPPTATTQPTKTGRKSTGGNCHHCKARKPVLYNCPINNSHRFCDRCAERHFAIKSDGTQTTNVADGVTEQRRGPVEWDEAGCPACTCTCPCASCRRKAQTPAVPRGRNVTAGKRGNRPKKASTKMLAASQPATGRGIGKPNLFPRICSANTKHSIPSSSTATTATIINSSMREQGRRNPPPLPSF
eukprot:TRINITY_DN729_c5_g1_i3.p1 TRINITY_DN729_c5_g1~~TRINITY_DN729_c5_g1_i3.p1  ORF type:complete len:649 (-),score=122.26 TRINITY_DN729_c5_g1_i3:149-1909(-)